jgi:hypothetical protein
MRINSLSARTILLLAILTNVLAVTVDAQSGRSWMNGFVFADSDTNGLVGANLELTGDQNNARLKSVHLSTKAENDGKYSLKDGDYTFRVSADGYEPYEIRLYIGSDMLTELHARLRKK